MSIRRLFPAALASTAIAVASMPAGASALAWTDFEMLSAPGAQISQIPGNPSANNRIAAGKEGTVAAVWIQNDGSDRVVVRRSRAGANGFEAEQVIPGSEGAGIIDAVVDGDGNTTVIWAAGNYSELKASTLLAGENTWSSAVTLASGGVSGVGMAVAPDETVTLAYSVVESGQGVLRTVSRGRNSAAWADDPLTVPSTGANIGGAFAIDYNASGDGVLFFHSESSGVSDAYISYWDASDSSWSNAPTLAISNLPGGGTGMVDALLTDDGRVAVVSTGGALQVWSCTFAADGSPGVQERLGSGLQVIPQLAVDAAGRLITTWEKLDLGTGVAESYYQVRGPGDSAWSDPALSPGGDAGAPISLTSTDTGTVRLLIARGASIANISDFGIGVTTWSAQSGSWGPLDDVEGASGTVYNAFAMTGYGSSPAAAMTGDGDFVAMWSQNTTPGSFGIAFAAGDASGPAISAVSVPASATAGDRVSVSATATDRWSDVGEVSWSFGDGATGSGTSASHAYSAAGTYTITITATDTAGNSSSTSRQVTVSDPPPAPTPPAKSNPKPKQTLAPVIEARLAGRSVTLNAKVTLKKGARCAGNSTATTAFGGRSYRVTLKLKSVAGVCRATGTIQLRKTPSLRTKLRISVAGKQVKSRTLTTRRG